MKFESNTITLHLNFYLKFPARFFVHGHVHVCWREGEGDQRKSKPRDGLPSTETEMHFNNSSTSIFISNAETKEDEEEGRDEEDLKKARI